MPNHVHLLLSMGPKGNVSEFMGQLKEYSAKEIIKCCEEKREENFLAVFSASAKMYKQKSRYQVWQERFDELRINNFDTFATKLTYLHNNPLQEHWQLVVSPEEYEYSSARFYLTGDSTGIPIFPLTEFESYGHPWAGDSH